MCRAVQTLFLLMTMPPEVRAMMKATEDSHGFPFACVTLFEKYLPKPVADVVELDTPSAFFYTARSVST